MNLSCIAHLNVTYLFLFFNRMNLAKLFPKQFVCSGAYPPYPEESKVHIIVHLIGFQDNKTTL